MAFRRDLERQIVLAEAVAEMRRQGNPECEIADLFTDFKGIQVTLAVVSRAIIAGRIDCKTAGRLLMGLQMASKLLRLYHRDHRGTQREKALTTKDTHSTSLSQAQGRSGQATKHEGLPQICADECRLNRELEGPVLPAPQAAATSNIGSGIYDTEFRVAVDQMIREFAEKPRGVLHGKWEEARAA